MSIIVIQLTRILLILFTSCIVLRTEQVNLSFGLQLNFKEHDNFPLRARVKDPVEDRRCIYIITYNVLGGSMQTKFGGVKMFSVVH